MQKNEATVKERQSSGSTQDAPALRLLYQTRGAWIGALTAAAVTGLVAVPATVLTALALGWHTVWSVCAGLSLPVMAQCGRVTAEKGRKRRAQCDATNEMLLGTLVWAAGTALLGFNSALCAMLLGAANMGAGIWLCGDGLKTLDKAETALTDLCKASRGGVCVPPRAAVCAAKALLVPAALLLIFLRHFRLGLALAQLVTLSVLLVCVHHQPLDRHMLAKLYRWHGDPVEHETLGQTLTHRLVETDRHRAWCIPALIAIFRILYPHTLENAENIRMDEENPLIFLANHGDVYGPVACMLHVPAHIRPWVISNIMVDRQETVDYIYKYDFKDATWLPVFLRMPVARLAATLSHWCMRSLDAVPVFRDHPRQLMNTFRNAVSVMQEGDSMLIFPENPNAIEQDHGYEKQGVGQLFSGFAMLAPVYYNRTGKRCRFIPVFASKKRKTLRFGQEIVYDPENNPMDERDRLVHEISAQLTAMYHELED